MTSSGMLRRVALVRIDILEERITSIFRVTRIGQLETTLTLTNNTSTLRSIGTYLLIVQNIFCLILKGVKVYYM
jgi:hypothetical protein